MMMGDVLLAVDITLLLKLVVPIIFIVIYVINQVLFSKANPWQKNPQPRGRNPQRRANQPPAERAMRQPQPLQGKPQGDASQLNAEIEQFLKRASQRRGERARPEQAAGASAAPNTPRAPMEEQPIDVAPIDPQLSSVAASVDAHLGHRGFNEHLAEEVGHADEEMERHLHEKFDHRVGTMGRSGAGTDRPYSDAPSDEATETPSTAAAFAELLRTPQGMRQAIVLGEILAPPEHRW
jgi:hypothetical protein